MENFIVSARKYRPATFETVVGQHHITGTLKNAIKNNQLAQAFLFCGPRGVGKTTCARILAKTINCTNLTPEQEACGTCESCISFQTGHSFNFHELDAASNNSVDDIRSLIDQVRIPPQAGKYKIYIIDEVHMLSANAFNAFLKTLEEPPSYAIFILATTEKHKILPTILSRCQIFDFNRIQVEDIASHLNKIAQRENIAVEADGLHIIAQKADGGLRDALSMFDQIVSYTNKNLTYKSVIDNLNILDYDYYFKLTEYLTSANVSQSLVLFDEILNNGFDGNNFINGLASHLRNLLVGKDPQTVKLLEVSENIKQKYINQSQQTSVSFILTALNLANQTDLSYKNSKNQRLQVELALIKMCHIPSVLQLAQLPASNSLTDNDQIKKKTDVKTEIPAVVPSAGISPKAPEKPAPAPQAPASNTPQPARPVTQTDKIVLKPQPLVNKTGGTLIPSLTSLESLASEAESKEPKYIDGHDKDSFTFEQLMSLWNSYAHKAKDEGKINIFTLLTSNEPILEQHEITVLIENKIQEGLLHEEMVYFLNFLRSQLKNFSIQIKTKKIEVQLKNRLYTSIEKYQYLAQKNPQLEEMRKRFNLDII
ncbi:DNA polymerase III subunit gamma/tau [Pedobacter nutrimenti]|uniref:DNA polymerase III subunit gamma/tau n=1 Tax=Pedobacter nutrimenti TaxID=1241337 RepID=UPI002931D4A7|nr:DNA polymerase III subunit gamma/tau [Pedobacter nutrimenti]